jgi:hypothetical protein
MTKYLEDSKNRKLFLAFLKERYCEEHLNFHLKVKAMKSFTMSKLRISCLNIYWEFIEPSGTHPVNLPSPFIENLVNRVQNESFSYDMFDEAESHALDLIVDNYWFEYSDSHNVREPSPRKPILTPRSARSKEKERESPRHGRHVSESHSTKALNSPRNATHVAESPRPRKHSAMIKFIPNDVSKIHIRSRSHQHLLVRERAASTE